MQAVITHSQSPLRINPAIQGAFGQAARDVQNTYNDPMGAGTHPAVREKALRSNLMQLAAEKGKAMTENLGVPAYMVDNASEISPQWVAGKNRVGLTAGASAPEILVSAVIDRLNQLGIASVASLDGVQEKVSFALPKDLA